MKLRVSPKLRIGIHSYEVIFNPHLQTDENRMGAINYRAQTIDIAGNLPQSQREVTLWHEVIHGIKDNFSLSMSDETTDNLAVGIVQFLQDNFDIELDFSDIPVKEG